MTSKKRLIPFLILLLCLPFSRSLAQVDEENIPCTHHISLPKAGDRITLRNEQLTPILIEQLKTKAVHNKTYLRTITKGTCVFLVKEYSHSYEVKFTEKGQIFAGYISKTYKGKSTLERISMLPIKKGEEKKSYSGLWGAFIFLLLVIGIVWNYYSNGNKKKRLNLETTEQGTKLIKGADTKSLKLKNKPSVNDFRVVEQDDLDQKAFPTKVSARSTGTHSRQHVFTDSPEGPQKQKENKSSDIHDPKVFLALKPNHQLFYDLLEEEKVDKIYHFTDRSNLPSICKNKGLFSWQDCLRKGIAIEQPGGSDLSRKLDKHYGLAEYVRLSFTKSHPMMFSIQNQGRLPDPVVLEISAKVILWKETLFSDMNATKTGHSHGPNFEDFQKIRFDIVKLPNHFGLSDQDRPYYQAEVLVKEFIPIDLINNIHMF